MYTTLTGRFKRIGEEKPGVAVNLLRDHRNNLQNNLNVIKQPHQRKKAVQSIKFCDYVLGRMVFFKEDHRTAWHKAEIKRIMGEI